MFVNISYLHKKKINRKYPSNCKTKFLSLFKRITHILISSATKSNIEKLRQSILLFLSRNSGIKRTHPQRLDRLSPDPTNLHNKKRPTIYLHPPPKCTDPFKPSNLFFEPTPAGGWFLKYKNSTISIPLLLNNN